MAWDLYQIQLPHWADEERWNRSQRAIFEEVCARFDDGYDLVLLDNPCGGGKSLLGYMVRQYLDVSGYYLVGTKPLQDQVNRSFDDVPVIKGRANYIPNGVPEEHHSWQDPTCADCDKSDSDLCSFCDDVETCPYLVARTTAAEAEMPCANMSYALGEWTSPRSKFRHRGLVILDEADRVEDELLSFVSLSISPRMQKRLGLRPPERKTVEAAWPIWFEYAIPHVKDELSSVRGDSLQSKRLRQQLERLLEKMQDIAVDLDGWVYEYANDFIEFKPITVDKLAPSYLWKNGKRWLAMTGSLGSPEQYVRDLGWDKPYATVFAPSTFAADRRPIYFCPSASMTKKREVVEWPKMSLAARATAEQFPTSNMLYHTHSYGLTKHLANSFEDYDRPVFHYLNADARDHAIKEFESTPGSILLAPSLDRGYDNRNIDVAVLCKVPSPYLGSKQVDKRLRTMVDGEFWYANATSKDIIQMYGRVMRSEDDSGILVILDEMFGVFLQRWMRKPERQLDGTMKRGHQLFPSWMLEAYHERSELRFNIRMEMKRALQSVGAK